MKKIGILIILMCLLMAGCSSKPKEETYSEDAKEETKKEETPTSDFDLRSSMITSGEKGDDGLYQLDLQGVKEKIENKEDFIIMVSQSTCNYCNTMKRTIVPYMEEHTDIPFFELEVDVLGAKKSDANQAFEELSKIMPDFTGGTPEFLHYKDGEMKDIKNGEMSYIAWNNFMIDCGYAKGEKQEEVKSGAELTKSDRLIDSTFTEIKNKLESKEDFYLLIVEEDRYSADLTKTLDAVLEETGKEVYVMNFTNPKAETDQQAMQESYNKIMEKITTLTMSPTLFDIKAGAPSGDPLVDNVKADEMKAWLETHK